MKPATDYTEEHQALINATAERYGDREQFSQMFLLAEIHAILDRERKGFVLSAATQRHELGRPQRGSYAELGRLARQSLRLMRELIVPRMLFAHNYAKELQTELRQRATTEPKFDEIIAILDTVGDCQSEAFAVDFDRLLTARAEAINEQWRTDPTALIALIGAIETAVKQPNCLRNNGCELVITLSDLLLDSGINLRDCPIEVSPELNPFVRIIESYSELPEVQTMIMLCSLIAWMLIYELAPTAELQSALHDEQNEDFDADYAAHEQRLRQAVLNLGVFCSRAVFDLLQMNVFAYSGLFRSCPTAAQAFCEMFGKEDSLANAALAEFQENFELVCEFASALGLTERS